VEENFTAPEVARQHGANMKRKFWKEFGPYFWGAVIGLPIAAVIAIGFERNPVRCPYQVILVPAGATVTVVVP